MAESSGVTLRVRRLSHAVGLPLPQAASPGSAGLDLAAAVEAPLTLDPGERALVPTGFCLELSPRFEGQVRPRSGLGVEYGVTCLNTPGTIDSDYRGEVKVLLVNHGDRPFEIRRGDRIAQLVVAPVPRVEVEEVDTLTDTARGAGGFGSTGID